MSLTLNILGKNIPIYGFFCIIGIVLAAAVALLLAKRKKLEIFDFVLVAIITLMGAWLGAKIFFLIVSLDDVVYIFNSYPILDALNALLRGGYVFYGGLVGEAIALVITLKLQKKNIFQYINIYAVVLPLGHALGRVGCFFAGCCYGMEYDGPLSYISRSYGYIYSHWSPPIAYSAHRGNCPTDIIFIATIHISKK